MVRPLTPLDGTPALHTQLNGPRQRIAWPGGAIPSGEQARRAGLQFIGESRYEGVNRPTAFFQATRTA